MNLGTPATGSSQTGPTQQRAATMLSQGGSHLCTVTMQSQSSFQERLSLGKPAATLIKPGGLAVTLLR